MLCPNCNKPRNEGDRFCANYGKDLQQPPSNNFHAQNLQTSSLLTTLNRLVLIWDKFAIPINFQFQDTSGMLLGETKGEMAFPLKYTLFDSNQETVLILDALRERGLSYAYLVHDSQGNVLASFRVKSSFMSRKYAITLDGMESMLLVTDAVGANYKVENINGGSVLATGQRHLGFKTGKADIEISDIEKVDHRILLGGMLLAAYLTGR
jgi:hypothetical protein